MAAVSPKPLLTSPDALPSGIVNPLLDSAAEEIRTQYLNNKPFRFVCIDEFLSREAAHRAATDLASASSPSGQARRAAGGRPAREASLPTTAELHQLVGSAGFAGLISRLTDEKDLLPNGDLFETSSVERFDGAFSVPHRDTGAESRRTVAGRVRLLIFLSPEWKGSWGGAFEIYDDPKNPPVYLLEPVFNRAIIHEISERVWVGRSRVSVPPLGEPGGRPGDRTATLKEVEACFGGLASEAEPRAAGGATIVEPVPKRFVAGYRLTEEDTAQLKRVVGQRDSLIRAFRSRQARALPGEDLGPRGGEFLTVLRYLAGLRAAERRRAKADQLAALRRAAQAAAASRALPRPQLARASRPVPVLPAEQAAALLAPVLDAGLFDAAWYCARYPDAGEQSAAWDHFVQTGLAESRDPHPLFVTLWYRAQLAEDPKSPPILHFLEEGGRRGLSPHPLFDGAWYLATNPDLAAVRPNPLLHFLEDGAREGRSPHPAFLPDWYKKSRGAEALGDRNPLIDYLVMPQAAAASPHPLFDGAWYLSENPDVAVTGEPPLVHYLRVGYAEGRDPHPLFDTSWYVEQNPDVAASGAHPFVHFLKSAPEECRRASPWFDPRWYLERNYDVRNAHVNPLVHYVTDGAREGRLPNPSFPLRALRETYGNAPSPMLVRLLSDDRLPQQAELRPEDDRAAPPAGAYRLPDLLQDYLSERFGAATPPAIREVLAVRARYADDPDAFANSQEWRRLAARLAGLAVDPDPSLPLDASIVLPAGNLVDALAALLSIFSSPSRYRFEVILGDVGDAARDDTLLPLAGGRIRYAEQHGERSFLAASRAIGQEAHGRYLVLFPADAIALPGWLDELIGSFAGDPRIGCVAGKRLRPDGTLQTTAWRDHPIAHARDALDPRLPQFNYVREAGLSLAASVAMPGEIWNRLGEFDRPDAAPGREDVELASRIGALGLKTIYQPFAELLGYRDLDAEGGVAGVAFPAPDPSRARPHMLVVDHRVPRRDRDAGSRAVDDYLKLFLSHGLRVSFWSDGDEDDPLYAKRLQQIGIEVARYRSFGGGLGDWLRENGSSLRYILLSRPHVAINYIDQIRSSENKARIIYLAHDVNWMLFSAEYAITHAEAARTRMEKMQAIEEKIWKSVDAALFFNGQESDLARRQAPDTRIEEVPLYLFDPGEIAAARQRLPRPSRADRFELLFVGGFDPPPNRDAVEWFVREIFGPLRERDDRFHLTVAGSNPPAEIRALAGPDIAVTGDVSEEALALLYRNASAAVVPLRYGAGVKGKVIEAFANAVPVVTTTVGIQGIAEGESLTFVADDPESFLAQIVAACSNDRLATSKTLKALDFIEMKQSVSAARRALAPVIEELQRPRTAGEEAAPSAPAPGEMRAAPRAAPAPEAKPRAARPGLWRRLRAALGFGAAPRPAAAAEATAEDAVLREALAEQQAVIAEAAAQLDEAAKRLEEARAELVRREAALAEQTERVRQVTSRAVEAEDALAKRDAAVASRDAELAARDTEFDLLKRGLVERDNALAKLEAETTAARAAIAQAEAARAQFAAELAERDAAMASRDTELAARDAELDLLRGGLVERDDTLGRVEAELAAARAAIAQAEAAREEVADSERALAEAARALEEREQAVASLQAGTASLQSEITLLRGQLAEESAEHTAALSRLAALRDELAARNAALVEEAERADTTAARLAAAQSDLAEREAALAEVTARAQQMAARVARAEIALAERERALAEREAALAEATLQTQQMAERAAQAEAALADSEIALADALERNREMAERAAQAEAALAEGEKAFAEATDRAQAMAARVARAESEFAEREQALAAVESDLVSLQGELAASRSALLLRDAALARAESEAAEQRSAVSAAKTRCEQLLDELARREAALAETIDRAQEMADRAARVESELADHEAQSDAALAAAAERAQELVDRVGSTERALAAESERARQVSERATLQETALAERDAALARLEAALDGRDRAVETARAELVALQAEFSQRRLELVRSEQEMAASHQAATLAGKELAALREELAAREEALFEASSEATAAATRLAAVEAEREAANAALAAARQRSAEHAAAAAIAEAEIASLRGVLAEQASTLAVLRRRAEEPSAEAARQGPASWRRNGAATPEDAGSTLPATGAEGDAGVVPPRQASGAPGPARPRQGRAEDPVGFVERPKR